MRTVTINGNKLHAGTDRRAVREKIPGCYTLKMSKFDSERLRWRRASLLYFDDAESADQYATKWIKGKT